MVDSTKPIERATPVRLERGLRKGIVLLLVCVAFMTIGILMAREEEMAGYFVASIFGLGTLVAAVNLHPRSSYLELGQEGFTVCSLFRRSFVPWHHVQAFVPIRMNANAMVGWTYTPAFTGSTTARQASFALAGVEAALPDTYGMKAAELAVVLNRLLVDAASNLGQEAEEPVVHRPA